VRLADPIERKLVGTWSEVETVADKGTVVVLRGRTTYRGDGTFVAKLDVSISPLILFENESYVFDVPGAWLIQDGLLISKLTKFEKLSELKLYGSIFKKALPDGTTQTQKIISVSDTHLITADPKTGKQSVAERVR
jgi:hypothetical protein